MTENNIISFWQFQSKLMWSRVQTTSVVEAGALVGWYQLWKDEHLCLAGAVLTLGALLLVAVSLLMRRDARYMEACEENKSKVIPHPADPWILRGRWIGFLTLLLLAACNIVLSIFTLIGGV